MLSTKKIFQYKKSLSIIRNYIFKLLINMVKIFHFSAG
ncbi:hypothetical protein PATSB16_22290 [Pandoraea thiooxydans]|nr:hypothetical protein PATSB16_22290 [Pandoraea thiooxydans]